MNNTIVAPKQHYTIGITHCRYERYERALVKGHKQSLDRGGSKENMDTDKHKYKSQVVQSMHDGNKLRSVTRLLNNIRLYA